MRRLTGTKRESGDSFVDDKVSLATEFFGLSAKSLQPIGGWPRNMNPATAVDADLDMVVLEGIPTINFGRGVPDPTPGGQSVNAPLNRRMRREARANLGTPKRISSVSRNYLKYPSASDGPFGSMSSAMSGGYPRSPYSTSIPYDKTSEWMNSVKTKVDSILGEQPKTMKSLLKNLKSAEEFVNSSKVGGRNFTLKPLYFLAQTQGSLANAVGGRFAGENTIPSQHDLAIYYVAADHMLSYPEAFDNVNLVLVPMNMPDIPVPGSSPGGAALSVPSYFSQKVGASRRERRISLGARTADMVSAAGVMDFSGQPEMAIEPKTSGAQIQSALLFPVYGDPSGKAARFSGGGMTVEVSATEGRIAAVRKLLEQYENTTDDEYPMIDTVSLNIMLGYMDKMRELEDQKRRLLDSGQLQTPGAVQAIDSEIKKLLDEAEMTSSASIAVHEFGHFLDKVGDYKMSRAYAAASLQSSGGLNSTLEYQRDMAELLRLKNGEPSDILEDVAYALSQDWTKKTLSNILESVIVADMATDIAEDVATLIDELTDVTTAIRQFTRDGGQAFAGWYERTSVGIDTTLQDSLRLINDTNVVKSSAVGDPEVLENAAKEAISRMSSLIPKTSSIARHPYLRGYSGLFSHMTELKHFDKLAEGSSPTARALIYAAAAEGMRRQITQAVNSLKESYDEILEQSERQVGRIQPIVNWINEQAIDMGGFRQGWRNLITDLVQANPNAVEEFMQLGSDIFRKDAWVDANGTFNRRRYMMDVLAGMDEQGGYAKGFGGQVSALFAINRAFNMAGNNGWKNLPDEQIELIRNATNGISEYAGPADYSLETPKPKMQRASNAETYAELHSALSMDIEETLSKLDDDEIEAVKRLRDEMIRVARGMIDKMEESSGGG